MKQTYNKSSFFRGWKNTATMVALLAAASAGVQAQEGSQGNTTIFGGAQMTYFGNQNFLTGGAGTQPGVILTERATATISYLNFSGDNLTATGVTDASYVDGYVRKYGTGQFIFPVGDNGFAGQFAADADGTSGAYFHADANTAITTNLFTGSNYPALPAGGPFSTSAKDAGIGAISNVEYWDIDGANAAKITLTWDAGSAIAALTSNMLNRLAIVGWDGSKWVKIPSALDVTSVLGGASALAAGSITTLSAIVPNTYTAYTFAAVVPDLTPTVSLPANNFAANGVTKNFIVNLFELLSVQTGADVQFQVLVPPGYTLAFNASQTSMTATGAAVASTLNNGDYTLIGTALGGRRFTFQAKPGITLTALGKAVLGFTVTRVSAQPASSSVITATIVNDPTHSVYDSVDENNIYTRIINAL